MNEVGDWLTQPGGLATRLRELRNNAKLNGKQMAEAAGWAGSKVSRIEAGHQMPAESDVETWARICGASPDVTASLIELLRATVDSRNEWRRRARHGQAAIQADYNELVAESAVIRQFDTACVPGLLQTPGYARAMLSQAIRLGHLDQDDVDAALALRMQRQQALYNPKQRFEFLIDEPVLLRRLVPADVMRGQLDRLQTVIGMPGVRLGIIPLDREVELVPQNGFVLYDGTAYAETFASEGVCSDAESGTYARVIELLWSEAIVGEEARRRIVAAAEGLSNAA